MLADEPVGRLGANHGPLLEFLASLFSHFEGGSQTFTRRHASFAEVVGARPEQFLAIVHDCFQILQEFLC